jgi:acetylornithine/N-succinyldiaminopimelate aminotransferase
MNKTLSTTPARIKRMNDDYHKILIERGEGVYLYLKDRRKILDLTSGATVANLGHGNQSIRKAINKQGQLISNTYFFNNEPRQKYRQLLLDEINKRIAKKTYEDVVFLSSGSEIIDCAIKAAMRFTNKNHFVSTNTSFHGRTIGCMELTQLPFSKPFQKKEMSSYFTFPADEAMEEQSLEELQQIFAGKPNEIAAVILEPYQGDGGLLFPRKQFFSKVAALCKSNNALLILDEMQSGFGRTGTLFYFEQLDIIPDIVCLGKAIANGLPTAAMVSTREITSSLLHEHIANSFGGNPLSMAAAIEVLLRIRKQSFLDKVVHKGEYFLQELLKLKEKHPIIKNIRGKALIFGIELDHTKIDDAGNNFMRLCLDNNLLVMPPKGVKKNIIKISPPLIIKLSEIAKAIERLDNALEKLKS